MIKSIVIQNDGYIECKSNFYRTLDVLNQSSKYVFSSGVNKMVGEIDSGIWGISYLISMYHFIDQRLLFLPFQALVNDEIWDMNKLSKYTCYMDESYPLFNKRTTIRKMIDRRVSKSRISQSSEQICQLFKLTDARLDRSLKEVGNERFKAMAAIAYSYGKEVFCFPWLSRKRFDYYQQNLTDLLHILDSLNMIAIVPIGK